MVKDVVNNLDKKDYQTTINNDKYDLKNAEKFLLKIVTKRISKNEVRELYENLIKPKVNQLKDAEGKGKEKRTNILNILKNIKSIIFDGIYLDYFDKSEIAEEIIAKSTKSRRQRLNVIEEEKQKINDGLFNHYFGYSSPDNMHERLSDAWVGTNKNQVYLVNDKLTKLKNIVKNVPKDKAFRIEENENIIGIVERILELNNENQSGLGLKILTPN